MSLAVLVTLLLTVCCASPHPLGPNEDAELRISPEIDDPVVLFNASLKDTSNTVPTCYPPSDPDFFSPGASKLDYFDCVLTVDDFFEPLEQRFAFGTFSLWYTSDHHPPPGLPGSALQMPACVRGPKCSVAVISTKALVDLVQTTGMAWRKEWDYPPGVAGDDVFDDITGAMILNTGGFGKVVPTCGETGAAGHGLIGKCTL